MKLLVLKLCSLVTVIAGLAALAHTLRVPQFYGLLETNAHLLPATPEESTARFIAWLCASAVATLLGVYGFLPKMGKGKSKSREIHFEGEHGDVVIQLDSVQRALTNVIGRMPEIKRVQVHVEPDKEGTRALIKADVVIYSNPEVRARQTANDVTEYIAQSAIQILGLEDLATIKLNVVGFEVNPKLVSKQIREECKQRTEAAKRPKLTYEPVQESRHTGGASGAGIMAAAASTAPAPAPEGEAQEIPTFEEPEPEVVAAPEPIVLDEAGDDMLSDERPLEALEEEPLSETADEFTPTGEVVPDTDGETPAEDETPAEEQGSPEGDGDSKKSWFS